MLLAIVAAALAACGGSDQASPRRPAPTADRDDLPGAAPVAAGPERQARELSHDPRMLLFDLQTALDGVKETRGTYPPEAELRGDPRWELQRTALDDAFDSWTYESDGETFRLEGESGGRALSISGGGP